MPEEIEIGPAIEPIKYAGVRIDFWPNTECDIPELVVSVSSGPFSVTVPFRVLGARAFRDALAEGVRIIESATPSEGSEGGES